MYLSPAWATLVCHFLHRCLPSVSAIPSPSFAEPLSWCRLTRVAHAPVRAKAMTGNAWLTLARLTPPLDFSGPFGKRRREEARASRLHYPVGLRHFTHLCRLVNSALAAFTRAMHTSALHSFLLLPWLRLGPGVIPAMAHLLAYPVASVPPMRWQAERTLGAPLLV